MNIKISPIGFVSYPNKQQTSYPNFCSTNDCFVKENQIKQKLLDNNISRIKFEDCYNYLSKHPDSVDDFIRYRNAAIKHKNYFVSQGERISSAFIDCIFSTDAEEVITAGNLLGEKNFIYSFHLKMDNFIRFINKISLLKKTAYYALLKNRINPQESEHFKTLDNIYLRDKKELLKLSTESGFNRIYKKNNTEIKALKSKISQLKLVPDKKNLIEIKQHQEKIKDLKKRFFYAKTPEYLEKEESVFKLKSQLAKIKNSAVKDPQDVITLCNIAFALYSLKIDANEVRDILKFNTEEEKKNLYNYLETKLSDLFKIDCKNEVFEKLKLSESEYFHKIFDMNETVKKDLRDIFLLFSKDSELSASEHFDNLAQNIATQQIFEQNGVNYNIYVNPDNDFSLNIKAKRLTKAKNKDFLVKNITTDIVNLLTSDTKSVLPCYREIIKTKLEESGFKLVGKNGDVQYDKNSHRVVNGQPPIILYRNNNPANYDDVVDLHKILKDTVSNTTGFTDGKSFELLNFANHIAILRTNEVNAVNYEYPQKKYNLTIKQIDMNDIKHSLFLGNHSHCCTAIGDGIKQDTAVKYIKNKLISGIEIFDGDKPVGNAMLFLAKVDDQLSLIIDNIETASEYLYIDEIRDGIFKFAKMLTKKLGHPGIPIYAGVYESKCDMSKYLFKDYKVKILGSSGEDKIYLDFIRERINIDGTPFITYLYKIE